MSSINLLSTGLDVSTVVSKLMEYARLPVTQMENRLAAMESKVSAYQTLNTRLSSLANSVYTLLYGSTSAPPKTAGSYSGRLETSAFSARTATSSNENVLTATASGAISSGSYNVTVNKLARAQTSVSRGYASASQSIKPGSFNGTIKFSGQDAVEIKLDAAKAKEGTIGSFDSADQAIGAAGTITINGKEFEINESTTLNYLEQMINNPVTGASDVSASIVHEDGKFSLKIASNEAGKANAFTISVNDKVSDGGDEEIPSLNAILGNFTQTQAAADDPTLRDLQQAINGADAGVAASIVYDGQEYRLMITSKETGAANAFSLTGDFMELNFAIPGGQNAQDAELVMNGIVITSSSNAVKDAIEGVTINLKKEGESARIDVGVDNDAIVSTVKSIISAYNSLVSYINSQFTYNEKTESSGVLAGDATLRSIQSTLQSIISTGGVPLGENDGYRSITQFGISVNRDGSLSLDEAKMNKALSDNFDAVSGFFLGYEKEGTTGRIGGMMTNLGEALQGLTNSLSNPVQHAIDGLNSNISNIQKSIEDYQRRLDAKEDELYAMYSAADQALKMYEVTSTQITSLLASLKSSTSS
jgi:flagellar hook-associated protein 2